MEREKEIIMAKEIVRKPKTLEELSRLTRLVERELDK